MTAFWIVAQVVSGTELKFRARLSALGSGAEAYIPLKRRMRKRRHSSKLEEIIYPAFPRFVFLYLPDPFHQIPQLSEASTRRKLSGGAHEPVLESSPLFSIRRGYRLMRDPHGGLVEIRAAEIERVKALEDRGVFDELPKDASLTFFQGSIHIVKSGCFEGLEAQVIQIPKKNAKKIDVEIAGVKANLPLECFAEA